MPFILWVITTTHAPAKSQNMPVLKAIAGYTDREAMKMRQTVRQAAVLT